jgi:hypothetical protein
MTTSSSIIGAPNYRQVAESLAAAHRRADSGIVKILLALDPAEREVRLVEVTTESPTTMEVLPVRFRATREVPLPSAVLLFSPEEWAARERREIDVPDGWERLEEL